MAQFTNVIIAIQARSTSTRFPKKVQAIIEGKSMLLHVIDACRSSATSQNAKQQLNKLAVGVVLAVPYGDELVAQYSSKVRVIEGPEHDVLERYNIVAKEMDADYVVRVTSDCPLISDNLITRHITIAKKNQADYVNNVDDRFRTFPDGLDCEVMSRRMLEYVHGKATDESDREHVTTFIRREFPRGYALHFIEGILGVWPNTIEKLSVDTPEELEAVRTLYQKYKQRGEEARRLYGPRNVHRF